LPSKPLRLAAGLCLLTGILGAEILQTSLLKRGKASGVVRRDPFVMFTRMPSAQVQTQPPAQVEAEKKAEDLAQRLIESIIYAGSITTEDGIKAFLLLSASGETVSVKQGDVVHNELKIIKIEETKIVVEYNQRQFVIPKKGDTNG
jgi:Tfp pilus assembly protein PilP